MPYNYVDSASNFCCRIIMLRVQCFIEKVFDLLPMSLTYNAWGKTSGSPQTKVTLCDINIRKRSINYCVCIPVSPNNYFVPSHCVHCHSEWSNPAEKNE